MRVAAERGFVEADFADELDEAGFQIVDGAARALGLFTVDSEGLGERLADGHAGVECGVRVLEDDGELASQAAHFVCFDMDEVDLVGCAVVIEAADDLAAGSFD